LPFWFDPSITPSFALKALGLSVLCAVVAGVLPALRATGGMLQPTLQSTAAGRSTLRLGRVAGSLIVIEVGLAVMALFLGIMAWRLFQPRPDENTRVAAADRYLVASIRVPSSGPDADRYLVGAIRVPSSGSDEGTRVRIASLQEELGLRGRSGANTSGAWRRSSIRDSLPCSTFRRSQDACSTRETSRATLRWSLPP
jgi:hypothetical protein